MTKLSKILLAVSITGFVAGGIIDFGGFNFASPWAAVLPLGAIAFGLFLNVFMLEKEMAEFDKEEAKKLQAIEHFSKTIPKWKPSARSTVVQFKENGYERQTCQVAR